VTTEIEIRTSAHDEVIPAMRNLHWPFRILCPCLIFCCSGAINAQTVNPLVGQWKKLVYQSQSRERSERTLDGLPGGEVTKASDIYLIDAPNAQPKLLIHGGEDPQWSPDGSKIAFLGFSWSSIMVSNYTVPTLAVQGYDEGMSLLARQIVVMNADGSAIKRITNLPNGVWDFAWSPVGNKIAYCESAKDGKTAIVTINADGSQRQEITKMGEVACAVGMPILRQTLDGNKLLTSLRMDGGKIAIMLVGPHGGSTPEESARGELIGVPTLAWSSDGGQIAFTGILNGKPVVGVVPTSGGKAKPLILGYAAQWSPDGKRLLFRHDSETSPSVTSIVVANADGSQPRKLLDNENAVFGLAWLPDSQGIVFASERETKNRSGLFRLKVDGTGLEKIVSLAKMQVSSPVVSPDGTKLIVDAGPSRFESSIWLVDLTTGREEMLVKGSHGSVYSKNR
jgi:Tol biopolymer transport system component